MELDDRESAELIWRFLELLIKQNGVSRTISPCNADIRYHDKTCYNDSLNETNP